MLVPSLSLIVPPREKLLPPMTNGPVPLLGKLMPEKLVPTRLLNGVRPLVPSNASDAPLLGATPPIQLAPTLKLRFGAPPPFHTNCAWLTWVIPAEMAAERMNHRRVRCDIGPSAIARNRSGEPVF